jgi:hypothetical protein
MFECEKCGSPTKAMVQMQVSAPAEMMHNFTKKNMASKEFRIMGGLVGNRRLFVYERFVSARY